MSRRAGLTLLEVVVAVAVTATVLVVLQRATADALRARRVLADDVQRRGSLRAALVHLVRELGTAVPGTLRVARTPGAASAVVEFGIDEPAASAVRYRLVDDTLERRTAPRFAAEAAAGDTTPLLVGVRRLDVRCRDDGGWHETWDSRRVPALLALDLELVSGDRLSTTLPLAAGAMP